MANFMELMDESIMLQGAAVNAGGGQSDIRNTCDSLDDFQVFFDTTGFEIRYEGLITFEKNSGKFFGWKNLEGSLGWEEVGSSQFDGDYESLTNKPVIPVVDVNKAYVDSNINNLKKAENIFLQNGKSLEEAIQWIMDNMGSQPPNPNPSAKELDIFIIAGQSNSVCYTGSNGASLDVEVSPGIFEYRPSLNNIQAFSNPVGEAPSNAGVSMGYSTGGTFFSALGNRYKELTGKEVCIIPAGNPGVSSSTYYNGGSNYNMMLSKWNSFKTWISSQEEYSIGKVMVVWHQGESGTGDALNMKDSFKKVFDDFKVGIPEIDQVFFCRISQNNACDNTTTKNYNSLISQLNDETDYVMAHSNAMKYYWLNQFADVHHYDQYACNDLGYELGDNIAKYYANGRVKPDTNPFELKKGVYNFAEFTGVELIDNQLINFVDSIERDKRWALCSSLYQSYATISPVTLNKEQEGFDFSFNIKLGDKEGSSGTQAPLLGGENSHISITGSQVIVSDGTRDITLTHDVPNRIVRGGNITKTLEEYSYRILKDGDYLRLYTKGNLASSQMIPDNFNATFNLFGKKGETYLEGIISDVTLSSDGESVTPPTETDFDYEDTLTGSFISTPENVIDGMVKPSTSDTTNNIVKINQPIELKSNESWEIKFRYKPTRLGSGSYWTILGNDFGDPINSIQAMQLNDTDLRIYSSGECTLLHELGTIQTLNIEHTLYVACEGDGYIHFKYDNLPTKKLGRPTHDNNLVGIYDTIGQCINSGSNMLHTGEIYELKITNVPTIIDESNPEPEPDGAFEYIDEVSNTILVEPTSTNDDGDLVIEATGMAEPLNFLDNKITLTSSQTWEIQTEFTPTKFGEMDAWTLLGIKTTDSELKALQFYNTSKQLRIYNTSNPTVDSFINFPNISINLNVRNSIKLACRGDKALHLQVNGGPAIKRLLSNDINFITDCGVLCQSYFMGDLQGHSGLIHNFKIVSVPTIGVEDAFEYIDDIHNTTISDVDFDAGGYLEVINNKNGQQNLLSERLTFTSNDPFELELVYAVTQSGLTYQGYDLVAILGGELSTHTGLQFGLNDIGELCLRHYYAPEDQVIPIASGVKNFGEFINLRIVNDGTGITKFIVDEQETTFDFRTTHGTIIDIIQLGNLNGHNGTGKIKKFHLKELT